MPLILNRCPGGGGGEESAEERACMRVIVDRLRAVPLFLQLVR